MPVRTVPEVAVNIRISRNICHGTATSVIWKAV
jgi:hypothetical protein